VDILSYPVGLLIGLLPVAADLGPEREPAHLLLDGRPVCELTARAPGCMVDLGLSPRIHLLELLRTDAVGRVTERVGRWVNRPGVHPEVLARGSCDEKAGSCEFDLAWAHPRRLDPDRVDLTLDGKSVWHGKERHAKVALAKGAKPQVLVVDARFSDGTRASFTKTLFAFYPEEARAELQAVPVVPREDAATGDAIASALKESGLSVRTVEDGDVELVFVFEPRTFDVIPGFVQIATEGRVLTDNPARFFEKSANPLPTLHVVLPDQFLTTFDTRAAYLGSRTPVAMTTGSRFADAVAAAGYGLGGSPRKRAVVLVLHGFSRPNVSTFTAAQAQAYLSEVAVPLVVWRVGDVLAPEWPEGRRIAVMADLRGAFDVLAKDVARQRIAWLEGAADLSASGSSIANRVTLAGRVHAPAQEPPLAFGAPDPRAAAIGPDGGPVHALATSGKTAWAGTHAGVFRSRDAGASWERASGGMPAVPVRCLVLAGGTLFAGTDAGLYVSRDDGSSWHAAGGLEGRAVSALAADAAEPPTVYAAVRGLGVLRSRDLGATFLATLLAHGDVRAVAVDPRDGSVWTGSDEGVHRSVDRGWSWAETSPLPGRASALAPDPRGGRVWAATSGRGLFVTDDAGRTWKATSLASTVVDALAVSADAKTLLAASPDGVFSSVDGGAKWRLARVGPVESIAASGAEWLAASPRGALRGSASGRSWTPSSAGLAAEVVFAARRAPEAPDSMLAGTTHGLSRRDGAAWKPVAGTPENPVYAIGSGGASELLVGAAGEIGRSFEKGTSWSWLPATSVFGFGLADGAPVLAATRAAILGSQDGGLSWNDSSVGLTKTFPLQVAMDPHEPSSAYAATAGSGVFRSTDGGRTWKPGGSDLARFIVRSVAVDPNAASTVYAGTDRGVYGSVTAGRSWTPLFDGLPQAPVYAIVADPESPLELFAGTGAGLFQSNDAGGHWAPFPAPGAIPAGVASLWLDSSRGELVVGTLGAGAYVVRLRGD
jgi:ligand-binding sensor domain-containing protein